MEKTPAGEEIMTMARVKQIIMSVDRSGLSKRRKQSDTVLISSLMQSGLKESNNMVGLKNPF
jgi:hypothetical protein